MLEYHTKKSVYPVEEASIYGAGFRIIRPNRGSVEGKPFNIIASYNPSLHTFVQLKNDLRPHFDSRPLLDWTALPEGLEREVTIGNRIIAWMMSDDGQYVACTPDNPHVILHTSPVLDIVTR